MKIDYTIKKNKSREQELSTLWFMSHGLSFEGTRSIKEQRRLWCVEEYICSHPEFDNSDGRIDIYFDLVEMLK